MINPNNSYLDIYDRSLNIFDDKKLYEFEVETKDIKRGESSSKSESNFMKYIDYSMTQIDEKFSFVKKKPGIKKIVSQNSFKLDVDYNGVYEKKNENESNVSVGYVENFYKYQEYHFKNSASIDKFQNIVSESFINDANTLKKTPTDKNIEMFINKYGTHF